MTAHTALVRLLADREISRHYLAVCTGVLTGGGTIQDGNPRENGIINNMLTILIRTDAFDEHSSVMHELAAIRQWVKDSPAAPGHDAVLVPGEPEKVFMADRLANGLPIDQTTFDDLKTCAVRNMAAKTTGAIRGVLER